MGLGITIKTDPESAHVDEQNFSTHRDLELDEWDELFIDVFHAPVEVERVAGEDRAAFLNRRKALFQEDMKAKGYEMLGRMWYVFRDTYYSPTEVDKLLEECLEIRQRTETPKALSALEKLIYACHEALRVKSGIFLACD
jgi:hypothetical protein